MLLIRIKLIVLLNTMVFSKYFHPLPVDINLHPAYHEINEANKELQDRQLVPMNNVIPLSVLTSIWLVILAFLYFWSQFKLQQINSQQESEQLPTKLNAFPKWYNAVYQVLIFSWIGSWILALFAIPRGISYIQKILYTGDQTVIFIAPNTEFAVMIPSMFLAMAAGGLILKVLVAPFPKFDQFQAIKSHVNAKGEWGTLFLFTLIAWLFIGAIYILAMDNYIVFRKDGLAHNAFLRFTETKYSWQNIDKVRVYANVSWDKKDQDWDVAPHFDIVLNNGKAIDIWGGLGLGSPSGESLITAAGILHSNGVKIELDPVSDPNIASGYVAEAENNFRSVFSYVEKLQNND